MQSPSSSLLSSPHPARGAGGSVASVAHLQPSRGEPPALPASPLTSGVCPLASFSFRKRASKSSSSSVVCGAGPVHTARARPWSNQRETQRARHNRANATIAPPQRRRARPTASPGAFSACATHRWLLGPSRAQGALPARDPHGRQARPGRSCTAPPSIPSPRALDRTELCDAPWQPNDEANPVVVIRKVQIRMSECCRESPWSSLRKTVDLTRGNVPNIAADCLHPASPPPSLFGHRRTLV